MEDEILSTQGSESQDSEEPVHPGTIIGVQDTKLNITLPKSVSPPASSSGLRTTARGVENARKVLRAFCIQKKNSVGPVTVVTPAKLASTPATTVLIGKLSSVKPSVKPDKVPDAEKAAKPPKPGQLRKAAQETYEEQQKKTLAEIEHMKRKMEMVELGIPLGMLCPEHSGKAMPSKTMPPIKTFLGIDKLDEVIAEAKKAKAEGREFKFDYHKFVPEYTNPFQRKTEEQKDKEGLERKADFIFNPRKGNIERGRSSSRFSRRYESRDYRKDDKTKHKEQEREKSRGSNSSKDRDEKHKKDLSTEKDAKAKKGGKEDKIDTPRSTEKGQETKVNLNDYLVCDSWSLDNDDKTSISSPNIEDKQKATPSKEKSTPNQLEKASISPIQQFKDSLKKSKSPANQLQEKLSKKESKKDSPEKPPILEKLQPVMDSFKFEIDDEEDDVIDIFDENTDLEKFNKPTKKPEKFNYRKAVDITLLDSVISEIKQETHDNTDKGLVEYDSPDKDSKTQGSVTPELEDSFRTQSQSSQHSDYSDGWRSTESRKSVDSFKSSDTGYKSSLSVGNTLQIDDKSDTKDSGSKSSERSRSSESSYSKSSESRKSTDKNRRERSVSVDREMDVARLEAEMSESTVNSLEMWNFVLKICQPLLFRHDRNKCYKETRTIPKLWYTENPKLCDCVKDRSIVYEELEMCKCTLIDRLYGCDQIAETPIPSSRTWYPPEDVCLTETTLQPSTEIPATKPSDVTDNASAGTDKPTGETEKPTSGIERPRVGTEPNEWEDDKERALTPEKTEEVFLDIEYQRFMQSVWPEVDPKKDKPSRSATPERLERKKKITEDKEQKRGGKKIKLTEDWSQESEVDEEVEKSKKRKKKHIEASTERDKDKEKRKRKLSASFSSVSSEDDHKKKKKLYKKKESKKSKQQKEKRRRLEKKVLKKLKLKKKKKKEDSNLGDTIEKANIGITAIETTDAEKTAEPKKKEKKIKKKRSQKAKKKSEKKKRRAKSSSSSDSSSSSQSESESDRKDKKIRKREEDSRKKKKTKKKKKHRSFDSESEQSDDLFDVNVLNNIKTERVEPRPLPRPIINVNTLQDDFSSTVKIKQEAEEEKIEERIEPPIEQPVVDKETLIEPIHREAELPHHAVEPPHHAVEPPHHAVEPPHHAVEPPHHPVEPPHHAVEPPHHAEELPHHEVEPPHHSVEPPHHAVEPIHHEEEPPKRFVYGTEDFSVDVDVNTEKNRLQAAQPPIVPIPYQPEPEQDNTIPQPEYEKDSTGHQSYSENYAKTTLEEYEQDNYEIYEQMAMEYQSGVANQISPPSSDTMQRIETVVCNRVRGEIKCDWRAGTEPAPSSTERPSRWGLKPGDVNIVLTGGGDVPGPVYPIESLHSQRGDEGYDEAYEVMYGASDRQQYGHCFEMETAETRQSLDDRINTVLSEVAKASDDIPDRLEDKPGRGRVVKRVSFADGYKPGQDSDVEDPPVRKRKKPRRVGCAWPCPTTHPDHVSLWDALPPPPPPPGSPPPPPAPLGPPTHLLRLRQESYQQVMMGPEQMMAQGKFDPSNPMMPFMPPQPPPGIISFT